MPILSIFSISSPKWASWKRQISQVARLTSSVTQLMIDWLIIISNRNRIGPGYRDYFVNVPSQWETTLQCNVVSHWLGAFTKWSLLLQYMQSLLLKDVMIKGCKIGILMENSFPQFVSHNMIYLFIFHDMVSLIHWSPCNPSHGWPWWSLHIISSQ